MKITDEIEKTVIELYKLGKSNSEISAATGIHRSTIWKTKKKLNIDTGHNVNNPMGEVYSELTILKELPRKFYNINGKPTSTRMVFVKCFCGNKFETRYRSLKSGNTTSCGCKNMNGGQGKKTNYVGQVYGRLTVVREVDGVRKLGGSIMRVFECLCGCGKIKNIRIADLNCGRTTSCGCHNKEISSQRKSKEYVLEKRYGNLEIIKETDKKYKKNATMRMVLVKCIDCKEEYPVSLFSIATGRLVKCQLCLPNHSKHPLYSTWSGMVQRCYNKNTFGYNNYGGRGISVCDEWLSDFKKFVDDVGEKPSSEHSLDRIDVNGHYVKENVRWANKSIQSSNTRTSIHHREMGKGTRNYSHLRIYKHFFGVKTKWNHIHHIDWDPSNHRPDNLVEVNSEQHGWLHRAENIPHSKLKRNDIIKLLEISFPDIPTHPTNKILDWCEIEYNKLLLRIPERYTKEDKDLMTNLILQGKKTKEIISFFPNRSYDAVRCKIIKLKIDLKMEE